MINYRFIGDIHGAWWNYVELIKDHLNTVQIGDFGLGFPDSRDVMNPKLPMDPMQRGKHRFIRGNHDDIDICKQMPGFIYDGQTEITENGTKIMYIGGAWSIDKEWRTPGVDWWYTEECSLIEFHRMANEYEKFKPDVMVTHECPECIAKEMFINGTHKPLYHSLTGQALEMMFSIHKPQLWIFGHWHQFEDQTILGTRFICLGIEQTMDVNL